MGFFEFSLADFSYAFVSVVLEGMPFILAGTLLAGFLDQFLPSGFMIRVLPRRPITGIAVSAALGLVIPMCECGVVPVIRRLLRKGLPVSHAIAYMLAAPVVNPIVMVSTLAAFQGQAGWLMALLRLAIAYVVACVAALAAHSLPQHKVLRARVLESSQGEHYHFVPQGIGARWAAAVQVAVADFLDVMVFFVLGVGISAVVSTALNQEVLLPLALEPWLATASLMLLAVILSLCSTSDAFIAATFLAFPSYAKLAFLVLGPMFDLKLLFIYQTVFRKRFIAALAVGLFVLVGLLCMRLGGLFL